MRKSTILKRLDEIGENWPEDWLLFSQGGSLLIIDQETSRVLYKILGIENDGGDPGTFEEGGQEYLNR